MTSFRLLLDACRLRPALIHMHFSAISNPAPLLFGIPLLALLSPVITTIHSGSFPERASHMSVAARLILKNAFQPVSRFIATSQPIAEALGQYCRVPCEKITVIPAYLSPSMEEQQPVSGGEAGVFLASGYGTEIYFWDGLLEAARPLSTIRELVLAFYTDYQQLYFEHVLERARGEFPFKVTVHRDLSAREFQRELARCSVFVRPTLKDGDSIALREALALGKTVVASDAAPRPPNCILFRSGDIQDLRRKLEAASAHFCTRGQAADDFSQPLLKVYTDLIARAGK